jgi:hypothetical protein
VDPWFVDDSAYIRLWAWLARAPVENEDARCPPVNSRPRPDEFRPPGVYEGRPGSTGVIDRATVPLRAIQYRLTP